MKVATCTPFNFVADFQFFGRDSGLLCRGFQAAGVGCVSVMPGTATPEDAPDLVRCSPAELADVGWWSQLGVDLVVLYAWGDPAYRPIADAIRNAGVGLIQSLDTAGLTSPYGDSREWWISLMGMLTASQPIHSKLRYVAKAVRDFVPALYEKRRLAMMDQSDAVAAVSPSAARSIGNYAVALGYPSIAAKTIIVPHPVPPVMTLGGRTKENIVLAVGRWEERDAAQKDPTLLLAVLKRFLVAHPEWKAEIIGRGSKGLASRCGAWDSGVFDRVIWSEVMDRDELALRYCRSRILFCPSVFESFHISSAEAVCCGGSVVVADHPLLASTAWFTTHDSGTCAPARTEAKLAAALALEAEAWRSGRRDAVRISEHWCDLLHAPRVAAHLLELEFPVQPKPSEDAVTSR